MADPDYLPGLLDGLYDPDRAERDLSDLLNDFELRCSEIADPVGGVEDRRSWYEDCIRRDLERLATRTERRDGDWSREVEWVPWSLLASFFGDAMYGSLPSGPSSASEQCREIEAFRELAAESCGGSLLLALEAWRRGERPESYDEPRWIE